MEVKEIMTQDVVSINSDDSAKQALDLLFKMRISGLPVIDARGKLVGMFTEKDVLKHILPSYIDRVGGFVYAENPKSTKNKFSGLSQIKVSQLMRKDVVTVNEDAPLCEVSRIMLTQKVRRMPVVNKENQMVGIVAREDLIKAYAKEAQWQID